MIAIITALSLLHELLIRKTTGQRFLFLKYRVQGSFWKGCKVHLAHTSFCFCKFFSSLPFCKDQGPLFAIVATGSFVKEDIDRSRNKRTLSAKHAGNCRPAARLAAL